MIDTKELLQKAIEKEIPIEDLPGKIDRFAAAGKITLEERIELLSALGITDAPEPGPLPPSLSERLDAAENLIMELLNIIVMMM